MWQQHEKSNTDSAIVSSDNCRIGKNFGNQENASTETREQTPPYGVMAISIMMLKKLIMTLEKRGIDQCELETLAGLAKGRISKWKDGQGEPTASQSARIARVLGIDPAWLIDDEMTEPPRELFTEAEQLVAGAFRTSGLRPDEAFAALMAAARQKQAEPARQPSKPPKRRVD